MKKKAKHLTTRILTDRECKIILFLWRWKVATTLTLREQLARDSNFWNFYHTLRKLLNDGYIEIRSGGMNVNRKYSLWHLTSHGYQYMREELGDLEDENYSSTSPLHDSYVLAFHYGNWILKQPSNVELFTEQELKCLAKSNYPHWVPNTKVHRPDGYTKVKDGTKNTVVAIEIELSPKAIERYEAVSDFYTDRKTIHYVLWLVKSKSLVETIQHAMMSRRSNKIEDHLFVLLEDFEKESWNAKIVTGGKIGISILEFYHQLGANTPTNNGPIASNFDPVTTFLKPIRSPVGLDT